MPVIRHSVRSIRRLLCALILQPVNPAGAIDRENRRIILWGSVIRIWEIGAQQLLSAADLESITGY